MLINQVRAGQNTLIHVNSSWKVNNKTLNDVVKNAEDFILLNILSTGLCIIPWDTHHLRRLKDYRLNFRILIRKSRYNSSNFQLGSNCLCIQGQNHARIQPIMTCSCAISMILLDEKTNCVYYTIIIFRKIDLVHIDPNPIGLKLDRRV